MLKVTKLVIKFIDKLRNRAQTTEEYIANVEKRALSLIVQSIQQESFPAEIEYLAGKE